MIEAGILENPHVDAALMFHNIAGSPVKEGTGVSLGRARCTPPPDGLKLHKGWAVMVQP